MVQLLKYLLVLLPIALTAQDSLTVTKNFRFEDGVYCSFEEFQTNSPSWVMSEVEMRSFTNPQSFLTQVEGISRRENGEELDMNEVWGICMDGVPFVRLPKAEVKKELPAFAALKLRGKICYYTYPDWRTKQVPVAAYNPYTGRPFLRSVVEREEQVVVEKILHFETGEVTDLTVENFLEWIQDDPRLVETVTNLPEEEKQEKLFKCLLIYVDRNETFLKPKKLSTDR